MKILKLKRGHIIKVKKPSLEGGKTCPRKGKVYFIK